MGSSVYQMLRFGSNLSIVNPRIKFLTFETGKGLRLNLKTGDGGLILFIKKQYKVLTAYKSPKTDQTDFVNYFENYLISIDLTIPLSK